MKKLFAALFVVAILSAGCVKEPVALYFEQPVVVSTLADTTRAIFQVPDVDSNGWHHWDSGADTITMSLYIKETAGENALISGISYKIYDIDGNMVDSRGNSYIPYTNMNAHDQDTLSMNIIVDEGDAKDLDDADGISDNVGTGYVSFTVNFLDEKGTQYSSVPVFRDIKVIKP
ncbi:MAG: hypothetical protein GWP03_03570 [Proteobacteria bacterium]|nr:hypothetical protein [Pseudomonadota bacterium]